MEFHPEHYSEYRPAPGSSALGLCFSHSYLDGVPFKISSAFTPPSQPNLRPELLRASTQSKALEEEYDYDTEEAVLAWSRAREEAKAKAIAERETAERKAAAERARAAIAAAESSTSDSDQDVPDVSEQSAPAGLSAETSHPQPQPVKPPWQLPASVSSTILTPTPIQTAQKKVQSPVAPKASVDLALFEQEDDPFDNMELQTINEKEELRALLGGTGEGGSQGPSPNPDSQALKNESEDLQVVTREESNQPPTDRKSTVSSVNGVYRNVPGPSVLRMFDNKPLSRVNGATASGVCSSVNNRPDQPSNPIATESTADEDYVHIKSDYSQQSVSYQRDAAGSAEPALGGELPQQYANSKVFKPVLPPIRPRGKSLGGESSLDGFVGGSGSTPFSSMTQSCFAQPSKRSGFMSGAGMSQSAYVMPTSSSGAADVLGSGLPNVDQHHNMSGSHPRPADVAASNVYSRYGNVESNSKSTTAVNIVGADKGGLRSAWSNPDLMAQSCDPQAGLSWSSPQPWNPYRPLPPTPVPGDPSTSPSPVPADQCQTPSPHVPSSSAAVSSGPSVVSSSAQPEYDPYPSLSSDAKTFVNNLTSMGFSRSRVSRAVEKFGPDERECVSQVVDHLLNVDKLVEKRFTPALAETGLHLFKNDIHKAEQFLSLHQQFTELGFTGERIQTALVRHELDRDKALDYLTA